MVEGGVFHDSMALKRSSVPEEQPMATFLMVQKAAQAFPMLNGANSHGSQSDIVLTDVAKADLIARGE